MKNIIEVIKANKGAIVKGVLFIGAAAGLAITGRKLISKHACNDDYENAEIIDVEE